MAYLGFQCGSTIFHFNFTCHNFLPPFPSLLLLHPFSCSHTSLLYPVGLNMYHLQKTSNFFLLFEWLGQKNHISVMLISSIQNRKKISCQNVTNLPTSPTNVTTCLEKLGSHYQQVVFFGKSKQQASSLSMKLFFHW